MLHLSQYFGRPIYFGICVQAVLSSVFMSINTVRNYGRYTDSQSSRLLDGVKLQVSLYMLGFLGKLWKNNSSFKASRAVYVALSPRHHSTETKTTTNKRLWPLGVPLLHMVAHVSKL